MGSYENFARVYDELMDNVPYEEWADFILAILKKNKITDKNINCLACVGVSKYEDDDYSIALLKFIEELKRKKE